MYIGIKYFRLQFHPLSLVANDCNNMANYLKELYVWNCNDVRCVKG